jgi:hypothetical protein
LLNVVATHEVSSFGIPNMDYTSTYMSKEGTNKHFSSAC